MYIYADILLITNIYVDFLLIKSAALLTHSPLRTGRGIFAAFIGSIFSLAIFLPKAFSYILIPLKLISSALIVLAAFGFESGGRFFRRFAVFLSLRIHLRRSRNGTCFSFRRTVHHCPKRRHICRFFNACTCDNLYRRICLHRSLQAIYRHGRQRRIHRHHLRLRQDRKLQGSCRHGKCSER